MRPTARVAKLSRMLRLCRPYRMQLGTAVSLSLIGGALALVVPLGLRELVDSVFVAADRQLLNRLGILLVVLFVLQAIVAFGGQYLLAWTGERIVADFRRAVFSHLQRLSIRFFDHRRTGELTSRLTADVTMVRSALTESLSELLTGALRLLGSVVLVVVLNWRLSLLILVAIPISALLSRSFAARYRLLTRDVQDRLAESNTIAHETLSQMRIVTAFARQDYESQRYAEAVRRLFLDARRRARFVAVFSALLSLLFFSALGGIFWFGGNEVLAGRLSAGDLVAMLLYAMNLSTATSALAAHFSVIAGAHGAAERLFEILDTEPDVSESTTAVRVERSRGELTFEHVSFGYEPGVPALSDISFTAQRGETIAIVGPSGAGKTTLLNLVLRFFDPTGGVIRLDGTDLRAISLDSLRRQIAVVTQDVQLFDDTIERNILYGRLDATPEEVRQAARAAHAHQFIDNLPQGYATPVGERGTRLSGGQKQRLAVARALLADRPLLLLDEATSALDSESETLIKDAMRAAMRGRTALVVAHRLSTVLDADRILVMDGGRIVDSGTHSELLHRSSLYRTLAARQFLAGDPPPTPTDAGSTWSGYARQMVEPQRSEAEPAGGGVGGAR
jgi:ATP-binding cassette, subfamily B, bacterial MsbA